jgi:hypothetical protein
VRIRSKIKIRIKIRIKKENPKCPPFHQGLPAAARVVSALPVGLIPAASQLARTAFCSTAEKRRTVRWRLPAEV